MLTRLVSPRPYLVLVRGLSTGTGRRLSDTGATPSLARAGDCSRESSSPSSSRRYEVRRELKPGDWTSVCSEAGSGRSVLLAGRVTGRGSVLGLAGLITGLGPSPSFSLMAGDRIEVKDENIVSISISDYVKNIALYL